MKCFKYFNFDNVTSTNSIAKDLLTKIDDINNHITVDNKNYNTKKNIINNNKTSLKKKENITYPILIITAKKQTQGKGRFKRKWNSKEGGAWFSIAIKNIDKNLKNSQTDYLKLLSFCASLAVIKTIKNYDDKMFNPEIKNNIFLKWPNDIIFLKKTETKNNKTSSQQPKKIAGILIENSFQKTMDMVIGIGINVNNKIDKNLNNIAISLKELQTNNNNNNNPNKKNKENQKNNKENQKNNKNIQSIEIKQLIDDIVKKFAKYLKLFYTKEYQKIINQWKKYCYNLNQELKIKTINKTITGTFIDISQTGNMLISTKEKNTSKIIEIKEGELSY